VNWHPADLQLAQALLIAQTPAVDIGFVEVWDSNFERVEVVQSRRSRKKRISALPDLQAFG